jgi:hypothetical protein
MCVYVMAVPHAKLYESSFIRCLHLAVSKPRSRLVEPLMLCETGLSQSGFKLCRLVQFQMQSRQMMMLKLQYSSHSFLR